MRHGGDLLTYKNRFDGELIDFSSNINPLGFPESVRSALADDAEQLTRYPDIEYRELKKEVGNYLGCGMEQVVLGNGAVEIIDNMILMCRRIIVFVPCFCEYMDRAKVHGREIVMLPLNGDFEIDVKLLEKTVGAMDLVILGNPNNPTGKRIPKEKLLQIMATIDKVEAILLLDEAFYEFCSEDYDSIKIFKDSKRICIIRAATKFFALPGLRLGYGFACSELAQKYQDCALPWNINSLANSIAMKIFRESDYINKSKAYIKEQREYLLTSLSNIKNMIVYGTHCNFILIELLDSNESKVFDFFLNRGILIRKASSFEGLDEAYIRVAVKGFEDNKRLVDSFREFAEKSL